MENSKKLKIFIELPSDPAIPFLDIYLEKTVHLKGCMHPDVHCSIITMNRTWKQTKCPLTEGWIKKMWYICTMKYYSAIKRKEIVPFAEM